MGQPARQTPLTNAPIRAASYAEILTPEHIQWEVHRRGLGCGSGPGHVLQEVVNRNGGRYQVWMEMTEHLRELARICAEVSGEQEMARIAGLPGITISLEHLRAADPGTRIVYGCELDDFSDAERERLPRRENHADAGVIFEGPFDPRTRSGSSESPPGG